MESLKNERQDVVGNRSRLKKLWQCIWSSGGSICDGPERARSAQEVRDEALKKCPWLESGF